MKPGFVPNEGKKHKIRDPEAAIAIVREVNNIIYRLGGKAHWEVGDDEAWNKWEHLLRETADFAKFLEDRGK